MRTSSFFLSLSLEITSCYNFTQADSAMVTKSRHAKVIILMHSTFMLTFHVTVNTIRVSTFFPMVVVNIRFQVEIRGGEQERES